MLINLHTHQSNGFSNRLEIINQYPSDFKPTPKYYSIGIHPWYINPEAIDKELTVIDIKLAMEQCLALGECGLDKNTDASFELQLTVFKKQLELAEKHQVPVIVHCVSAFQELLAVKKSMSIKVPMIVHGFRKHAQLAKQLIEAGFYLSFGKGLLHEDSYGTVFRDIPNERIFLETDSADYDLANIYKVAAAAKGIKQENLEAIITTNFETVFGVKEWTI